MTDEELRARLAGKVVAPAPLPPPVEVAAPVAPAAPVVTATAKKPSPEVVVKKRGRTPAARDGEVPARSEEEWALIDRGYTEKAAAEAAKTLPALGTPSIPGGREPTVVTVSEKPTEAEIAAATFTPEEEKRVASAPVGTAGLLPVLLSGGALTAARVKHAREEKLAQPETRAAQAATRPEVRKSVESLLNDSGLRAVVGIAKDAPIEGLRAALVDAGDPEIAKYYRYRLSEMDKKLPEGQRMSDRPADDPLRQAVKERVLRDVATLRTIGMWGPSAIMPIDRDPTSVIDALKPTAEVVGIDETGKPLTRVQSMPSYLLEMGTMLPEMAVSATGIPSLIGRSLFGEKGEESPDYEFGQIAGITVPFSPAAIRERRGYSKAIEEADIGGTVERAVRRAGGAVGAPEPMVELYATTSRNVADLNATLGGLALSLASPDVVSAGFKGAHALGLYATKAEKLANAATTADRLADIAADSRKGFADLVARNAPEAEVTAFAKKAAEEYEAALKAVPQTAKDAIADGARVRFKAEKAAEEVSAASGYARRPYSNVPMAGALDDALAAEQAAIQLRDSSKFARLGFGEGLRRVANLATTKGANSPPLTPAQAAAYGERLFDSAEKMARELAIGTREALVPVETKGAVAAAVEAVATNPTPETKDLVAAARAADAARRTLDGERLAKVLGSLQPRIERGVHYLAKNGADVSPAQWTTFRDTAVSNLEKLLIGANGRKRAEGIVDAALHGAPTNKITPETLAALDGAFRKHGAEAAEVLRRTHPLRGSAKSIMLGESASRFRGVRTNPTLARVVKQKALEAVRFLFVGGNEMAPWAKEGLSREAREWTLAAERMIDAVASDAGKVTTTKEAAGYLTGAPGIAGKGMATDGADRFTVFTHLVNVTREDVEKYLLALLQPPIGRPEPGLADGAMSEFYGAFKRGIAKVRAGKMDAEEFIDSLHAVAEQYAVADADTSSWVKITTAWIGVEAENLMLLNKGFGDGIVFSEQDVAAFNALSGGSFVRPTPTATLMARALDPSGMVERAVATVRYVGVGGMEGATEFVAGTKIGTGGKVAVPGALKNAKVAEAVGLFGRVMDENIYVPRMVRERMMGAIERAYKPQTYTGMSLLSVNKLVVTRGLLSSKAGYLLNNIPGDTEQIMLATGMGAALKTALRSEGASVAALLRTAVPALAGAATRAVGGEAVAPLVRAGAGGLVEFGLGAWLAVSAGKNKGAIAKLIRAGGEVGEKLSIKMSNMLGLSAMRIEVGTIMDGGKDVISVGDRVYTAADLRRIAIEGGVYDSFDRAELAQEVTKLARPFRMAAEGVNSLAEMVSLRRRLGLYVTLIEEGMRPEKAAAATVEALFDYRAVLSEWERESWLRQVLLPFWSWQKSMNRLVVGSVTSPMGAYRMKVTHQLGMKAQEMMASAPTTDGDDVGLLTTFMAKDELPVYEKFKRFRDEAEKVNPRLTPELWNAIILASNPSVPQSIEWAQDTSISEGNRLSNDDLALLREYLAPWYTESMARSYLRDRAQFRVSTPVTTSGKPDVGAAWHAVAPHSGLDGALQWYAFVAAGTLSTLALAFKSVGLPGDWIGLGTPGEHAAEMMDPSRAMILGSLIAALDPSGRSPDRVAKPLASAPIEVSQAIAGFLYNHGLGDGLWSNAAEAVKVEDRRGKVVYTVDPALAAAIHASPIADLNARLLMYEGSKGEDYKPDPLRIVAQSVGISTPTVTTMDGLREYGERSAWVKKQLSQFTLSRDGNDEPTLRGYDEASGEAEQPTP